MLDFIKTKLLFEYKEGQLIGLGFGNIIRSDADIIIVSAFENVTFVQNSSIGALNSILLETADINLQELITDELIIQGFQNIDLSFKNLSFKRILIISMGKPIPLYNDNLELYTDQIINNLKKNLNKARIYLSKEVSSFTIDITALGTKYGGLRRKESFDMLINWATDLFNTTEKVNLLRFVAFDLDTFVDYFESTFRLQTLKPESNLSFTANIDTESFTQFKRDINSALRSLDDNPRGVIITCRSIIESIIKSRIANTHVKLSEGILMLKTKIPPSIYSYLTTCRLLGNFSNHDPNFIPTRRDAEGILLLTLRIVEWHLTDQNITH